ncbi:hypothetical protein ACHAPE_001756 [Trichoderma viride]
MDSAICPAYLSTIEFDLNPIEAKSARRYKHVALVIPLDASAGQPRQKRIQLVKRYFLRTISKAVASWPILGGSIRVSYSGDNNGQLTVRGPMPNAPATQRSDLIEFECTLSDESLLEDMDENEFFFPTGRTPAAGVAPVLLKVTFLDSQLVLGFSFYEAIADNAFIQLFLSSMVDSSWNFRRGHGKKWETSARLQLIPIPDSPDMLPFYDPSNKSKVLSTPSNQLVSGFVEFQLPAVLGFIQNLRKYHLHCGNNILDDVKDNDVMAAILWAAIINARRLLGKVQPSDQVKMNILVPGEPMASTLRHWSYCGNFTVPAVATASVLGATDLGADATPYRNSYYQEYIPDCGFGIRWISLAAHEIREAIDDVDEVYVRRVMGAKKEMSMEEDSAAYERCLDRSRTGTTFEDWTGFYRSGRKTTGIPFADTRQFIRILPCVDDLEEGKVILLSHFKASKTANCQIRRLAWFCLETETMKLVREQLEAEGWIKKESMTDMATPLE